MKKFLEICPILFFFFPCALNAQVFTVQPSQPEINLGVYTNVSSWFSAPAGNQVNYRFGYSTQTSDTSYINTQAYISLGISHNLLVENLVVDCDSVWIGFFEAWIAGQDTIQSNSVSWSFPCAGNAFLAFSVEEIIGTGVVVSFDYNSGGVEAGLYWQTSIDESPLELESIPVFGVGTHTDTLFLDAGQTYQVCYPEINNGQTDPYFLPECITGIMPSFVVTQPEALISAIYQDESLISELFVTNSGNLSFEGSVSVERMLCDGSYEVYDEFNFSFNELVTDSLITLPTLDSLPQTSQWRFVFTATNSEYDIEQEIFVDVALGLESTVSFQLNEISNGFYEVEVTWNDQGAGNSVLQLYVDDELVSSMEPNANPFVFEIPEQISAYTATMVEVVLTSNACLDGYDVDMTTSCTTPTHILEAATSITENSAMVQVALANFWGCVASADAMVGIVLVGQDTVWTQQSVNTDISSNYLIPLTGLVPGTTYIYQAILCGEGECFTTNFVLSFTTLSDDPVFPEFTNSGASWDDMWISVVLGYNIGDVNSSDVKLRIRHNPPGSPEQIVLDIQAPGQSYSFDLNVSSQYGTHSVIAELYNSQTNEVYDTAGPFTHTYQQPVSVQEIGKPVTRFDVILVHNILGQEIGSFSHGELLNLSSSLPVGLYIFTGVKEKDIVSSKIYLGQ